MKQRCKIDGCENEIKSRGWCIKHYTRWFKHGDPTIVKSQKGINNPMYKHGAYCAISYCTCGKEKDHRSKFCSLCARRGYSMDGERLVADGQILSSIKQVKNFAQLADLLGVSRQMVTRASQRLNADISHFDAGRGRPISTEKILGAKSRVSRGTIRKRVLEDRLLEYICAVCSLLPNWHDQELTLQLDHINGKWKDNRLANLRWLCPNCHSQTSTYTGNGRGGAK